MRCYLIVIGQCELYKLKIITVHIRHQTAHYILELSDISQFCFLQ